MTKKAELLPTSASRESSARGSTQLVNGAAIDRFRCGRANGARTFSQQFIFFSEMKVFRSTCERMAPRGRSAHRLPLTAFEASTSFLQ